MTEQILQTINQSIDRIETKIGKYQDKLELTNISVVKLEQGVGALNELVTVALDGVKTQHKNIEKRIDTLSLRHDKLKDNFRKQNKLIIFASGGIFVLMNILWPRISGFLLRFIG